MTCAAKADRGHARGDRGIDTRGAVLDDETAFRRRGKTLRGIEKQVGRRFTTCDHRRAEQVSPKPWEEACQRQFVADLFRAAARRNADGIAGKSSNSTIPAIATSD